MDKKKRPPFTGKNSDVAPSISTRHRDDLGRYMNGNPGSPKRYPDASTLKEAILKYFEACEEAKDPLTMTGLAISLGLTRQALINYEKEEGYEFAFEIIQYAKQRVEEYTEKCLHNPRANMVGAIFSLKNNWGWVDRQDVRMDQRKISIKGMEWIRPEEHEEGN